MKVDLTREEINTLRNSWEDKFRHVATQMVKNGVLGRVNGTRKDLAELANLLSKVESYETAMTTDTAPKEPRR